MTGRWADSNRRARLPKDWARRVAAVKMRAHGRCQAAQHVAECDGVGTECDHIRRGDDHALANLQLLSSACHKAKTQAEMRVTRTPRRHPSAS